jgi:hypothetical protein
MLTIQNARMGVQRDVSNAFATSGLKFQKLCSVVSRTGQNVLKVNGTDFQDRREGPESLLTSCQNRRSS